MWVIYGLALTGAGILLLAYASKRNNAPAPPRWLRRGWIQQIIVFVVVVLLTFGGTVAVMVVVDPASRAMDWWETIGALVIVGAFVALWRTIMRIPKAVPAAAAPSAP